MLFVLLLCGFLDKGVEFCDFVVEVGLVVLFVKWLFLDLSYVLCFCSVVWFVLGGVVCELVGLGLLLCF